MFVLPTTQAEFDAKRTTIETAIRERLASELATVTTEQAPPAGDIWSTLPRVDSKIAFKAAGMAIESVLGVKLPASLIKNGGYDSIDETVEALLSQLREHCSDAQSATGS
jgi:hypothetical protein